jgi:cbb3-type cytochrome c oxidase subunit II
MKRLIQTHGFHRKLEGWPIIFTVLTVIAILVGTVVELTPVLLVPAQVEHLENFQPPTPLEIAGRDLYIREGCNNCHSQMVRPFRHEIERYGEYSKPGEYVYDTPHLWGSKRTGPDLFRVGGKYPDLWHVRHMENPRSTSPGSIMPPYDWMLRRDTDFAAIPAKMRALSRIGVPYSEEDIANGEADARAQAQEIADGLEGTGYEGLEEKEIIAMVAYLQRLGTDLNKPPQPIRDIDSEVLTVTTDRP